MVQHTTNKQTEYRVNQASANKPDVSYQPYRIAKRRLPISVRFAARKGYATLQIRITIDSNEGSPFSTLPNCTTLQLAGVWNQKQQRRTDRTDDAADFNDQLADIEKTLRAIYKRQMAAGVEATPRTIQREWQTGVLAGNKPKELTQNSLLTAYQSQVVKLKNHNGTESGLAPGTLNKWEYGQTYLVEYLTETENLTLEADQVSAGWAKDYHTWLMKAGPMCADTATRYVKRISGVLDSLVDYRKLTGNPLSVVKFGRAKTKDVYFLEKPHLQKFWQLDTEGPGGVCIWWMGVVLLTGLDYPDAVRYVQNRATYDKPGNVRPFVEIKRNKGGALCKIPVWPELTALLERVPVGTPPTADEINDYMKGVEVLIGFPRRFTLKIGRKTAGYIMLLRGYTIRAISRILGHSSTSITERYYLKVTGELVEQETDNL